MTRHTRTDLRRRPIEDADLAVLDRFLASRFPDRVPSPIKDIVSMRRIGGHLCARILLFDGGPCMLIVGSGPVFTGEDRWIHRCLPIEADRRPFFFHRTGNVWMRFDGSREQAAERYGRDFV